ncbi:MAG: hypothetical protein M0Z61_02095 [Nitrospiraceae bacterium]|nr:hypothetical protein [Nitrospiraceae bacterium]
MRRHIALLLFLILNLAFSGGALAMSNADYSIVPSYVVQNVQPNIMILLDNSGSFYNYAYKDSGNDCSNSASPCTGYVSSNTYYGYFNSKIWYQYSSSRFIPDPLNPTNPTIASSVTNPNPASDWDGNFLNWLTMRETDVARKALTGGLCDGSRGCGYGGGSDSKGYDRLVGIGLDSTSRGAYKQVASPGDFTPYSSPYPTFESVVSSSYGQFQVWQNNIKVNTFNVKVQVPIGVEGVLQRVVAAKARVGLAVFGSPWNEPPYGNGNGDGANIIVNVAGQSLSSVVNQINNTKPTSNTPTAEALFEVAGYMGQASGDFNQCPTGPGPNYSGGKYTVNSNDDPYNYGSGGKTQYPTCSKSFVLLITDGEPCEDGEIPSEITNWAAQQSPFVCTNSGSLSDGSLTGNCPAMCSDGHTPAYYGGTCPAGTVLYPAEPSFLSCPAGNAAAGLEDVALWMHDGNPTGIGGAADDIRQMQPGKPGGINSISLYTVYAFGHGYSSTLLKYAAINGGFNGSLDNKPDVGHQSEWTTSGTGDPDNFFDASEGTDLENALTNALSSMLKRASSGTAASVLASGQGSGASLVQAVFYPRRSFGNDVINWTGAVHDFWYYVDPFFNYSNTLEPDNDYNLTLTKDDVVQFYFDQNLGNTMADRFLSNANGSTGAEDTGVDGKNSPVPFESLNNLWEAGLKLWNQSPSSRSIYTNIPLPSGIANMVSFSESNDTAVGPYLNVSNLYNGVDSVIQWTEGYDLTGYDPDADGIDDYRSRTVDADNSGNYNVWKLGDILDSTPKIVSWMPLNPGYAKTYNDTTYSLFTKSSTYLNRGTVYAGSNDGMLHAFNMGLLNVNFTNSNTKAQLTCKNGSTPPDCGTGTAFGAERWAFIPENVLPYLQYIAGVDSSIPLQSGDPGYSGSNTYPGYGEYPGAGPGYSHVYTVDLTPYVFDASIAKPSDCSTTNYWNCTKEETSWKTILIGGMRMGGASSSSASCYSSSNPIPGSNPVTNDYCVTTPTSVNGSPIGYSSYFALDVTDEDHPKLLWEFSNPNLGFATTGPAIVRVSATTSGSPDNLKNGRWFAVFGSGPTGPINTTYNQFLGYSNQNLKYFVVDLATGTLVTTIDTAIPDAFSGDLFNATNDSNQDYQDDAIYGGYVKSEGGTNPGWTRGGVGRILTVDNNAKEFVDSNGDPDPSQWTFSKVIDGIGPVTTSVSRLQNNITNQLWLYFGTGRDYYSYYTTQPVVDDMTNPNYLVGMTDPCYLNNTSLFCNSNPNVSGYKNCSTSCASGLSGTTNLVNVPLSNTTGVTIPSGDYGWYIALDTAGCYSYWDTTGDLALVNSTCEQCPVPTGCSNSQWSVTCPGDKTSCPSSDDSLYYGAERMLTDPYASPTGAVYFTTYKPYDEQCGIAGKSFLWAAYYNNGASLAGTMAGHGVALVQVSTGSIQQINLSTALTEHGGRSTTNAIEGEAPTAGSPTFTSPPPLKMMLHIREEK